MRALYEFSGEPGTAELSIVAGQVLTVIRDNVGDGWCEGYNESGKSGLFPAAYVQVVEAGTPAPGISILFIFYNIFCFLFHHTQRDELIMLHIVWGLSVTRILYK